MDSFSTICDHFINETDLDYRINAISIKAANELGLPIYTVTSNLNAFTYKLGGSKSEQLIAKYPCLAASKAG